MYVFNAFPVIIEDNVSYDDDDDDYDSDHDSNRIVYHRNNDDRYSKYFLSYDNKFDANLNDLIKYIDINPKPPAANEMAWVHFLPINLATNGMIRA